MDDWGDLEVAGPWGVRVMSGSYTTCIFSPGNLMSLEPGRVKEMLDAALAEEGHIVCHQTLSRALYGLDPAICNGFTTHPNAARSLALRYAAITNCTVLVDPPTVNDRPTSDE